MDETWKTFGTSGAVPDRLMVRVVDGPGDEAASESLSTFCLFHGTSRVGFVDLNGRYTRGSGVWNTGG
jgi:hypothetical protein